MHRVVWKFSLCPSHRDNSLSWLKLCAFLLVPGQYSRPNLEGNSFNRSKPSGSQGAGTWYLALRSRDEATGRICNNDSVDQVPVPEKVKEKKVVSTW